ncbi:hypothetical protein [Marinospirillum sp.]|uniref:hypothetical protein n=1 Tax=Marinospirillum sp. TaxID=2183934 RepID=UPI00384A471D
MIFKRIAVAAMVAVSFGVAADSIPGASVEQSDDELHLGIYNTSQKNVVLSVDQVEVSLKPDSALSYDCGGNLYLIIELPDSLDYHPIACSSKIIF